MSEHMVKRAILLLLFGMASFFFIAALIALVLWITTGDWRQFLREVALVSVFMAIPVGSFFATQVLADRL